MPDDWQPIDTAPKDGTRIDLWAKTWNAYFDRFEWQRFPACYWSDGDSMTNIGSRWVNLDKNWRATHWMHVPQGPREE